jgi:hypothetical protein
MAAYRQGSTGLQIDLEFDGPIRRHSRQIIRKHIRIFTDHRYLIQALGNNGVDGCSETSDRWQLHRHLAIDRRVKVNQMSGDVQYSLMHLHPVHAKNDINSLTFQDDKGGGKHSPSKLKWDFTNHLISNHSASQSADRVRHLGSTESKPGLLSIS